MREIPSDKIQPLFAQNTSNTYKIGGFEIINNKPRIQTGILKAQYNEIFGICIHPQAIGIQINTLDNQ